MSNSKKIPLHEDAQSVVQLAPFISRASTNNTGWLVSAADVVTLNSETTFTRFYAEWGTVVLKFTNWSGSASSSDFDVIVPNGQIVDVYNYDTFVKNDLTTVNAIKLTGTVTNFVVLEY